MARHARSGALSSLKAPILALLAGVGFVVQVGGSVGGATDPLGAAPVTTTRIFEFDLAAGLGATRILEFDLAAASWPGGRLHRGPVLDPALPAAVGAFRAGSVRVVEGSGSGPNVEVSSVGPGAAPASAGTPGLRAPSAAPPQGAALSALCRAGRLAAPATGPPVLSI